MFLRNITVHLDDVTIQGDASQEYVYDGKNKDKYEYGHFNIFLFIFVSDSAWITKAVK